MVVDRVSREKLNETFFKGKVEHGFSESAGKFAKAAGKMALEETKAANERSQEYKAEMPFKSDRELAKICIHERSHSPLKAGAALQELKSRGYTNAQEIKALL